MGSQPVTTNPVLIMLINMIVVFAVLWGLSWVIRIIRIIDPTQKKKATITEAPAAVSATAALVVQEDDAVIVAVIAAAIAAYDYNQPQIVSIRRIDGRTWRQASRFDAINAGNQMQ